MVVIVVATAAATTTTAAATATAVAVMALTDPESTLHEFLDVDLRHVVHLLWLIA